MPPFMCLLCWTQSAVLCCMWQRCAVTQLCCAVFVLCCAVCELCCVCAVLCPLHCRVLKCLPACSNAPVWGIVYRVLNVLPAATCPHAYLPACLQQRVLVAPAGSSWPSCAAGGAGRHSGQAGSTATAEKPGCWQVTQVSQRQGGWGQGWAGLCTLEDFQPTYWLCCYSLLTGPAALFCSVPLLLCVGHRPLSTGKAPGVWPRLRQPGRQRSREGGKARKNARQGATPQLQRGHKQQPAPLQQPAPQNGPKTGPN